MPESFPAKDRPLSLRDAAQLLGLSYERLRVLVKQGRLKTNHLLGVGRVVAVAEVQRFRTIPRIPGRPRGAAHLSRRFGARSIHSVGDLLHRVAVRTGQRFTDYQRRNLVRAHLLRARTEFPRGQRGRRAWLACQYRRLVRIAALKHARIAGRRDLFLALKFAGYRMRHDRLTAAMLSYLAPWTRALVALREDEVIDFTLEAAKRASPYRTINKLKRDRRAAAYEAMLGIGSGGRFRPSDMRRVMEGLGLPYSLLAERSEGAVEPDWSWSGLFSAGQAANEKVAAVVESVVTRRDDGRYEFRLFCTPQEMDQAWAAARVALLPAWPLISHPAVSRRVLMASIVLAVMELLVTMREEQSGSMPT